MAELFTSLPRHLYCYVERRFIGDKDGLEPCSWFGLTSITGRAWGLTLLLENGAIYSQVPPHALYFPVPGGDFSGTPWPIERAQMWDCFGPHFAVHEYEQLAGRDVDCWIGKPSELMSGEYLFTAQHYGDSYAAVPEQAKQFHFLKLDNGRLTALPANRFIVHDRAFTRATGMPDWLKRQEAVYTCENE